MSLIIKTVFKEDYHMKTIAETLLEYYNSHIATDGPVTLDWLKRQRIVKNRYQLNLAFGSAVVDSVLGRKNFLAEAEEMLKEVEEKGKLALLPRIAHFLAYECDTMLDIENPIREKYTTLSYRIPVPVFSSMEEFYFPNLHSENMDISPDSLSSMSIFLSHADVDTNPFKVEFFMYLQKSAFHVLKTAFEEIRNEVEAKTK